MANISLAPNTLLSSAALRPAARQVLPSPVDKNHQVQSREPRTTPQQAAPAQQLQRQENADERRSGGTTARRAAPQWQAMRELSDFPHSVQRAMQSYTDTQYANNVASPHSDMAGHNNVTGVDIYL